MGFLRRLLVGAARGGVGIAGAFDEQDAGDGGKAFQILHRIFHRLVHHAVDDETMLGRIDGGNAVVMALEMQARRRDDAHPRLQRREAGRAAGGRQPHHLFGGGTLAIITLGDAARHAPGHVAVIGGKRPHRHDGRRRRQQAAGAKEGATAGGAGRPLREHAVLAFAIRLFVLSRSRT